MAQTLRLIRDELTGDAPLDTAISRAVLQRVTTGELDETLQVGTPHRVVAFGKHDSLTTGFADAVAIAEAAGHDPTVRIAGGRAVVFSPTILRFAWTVRSAEPARHMHERFGRLAGAVVAALGRLGVPSEIGEVPNEYCAGQYSVHVLGHRKVMGVGQRLTRNAAQVGGMIVLDDPEAVNDVLVPIYDVLGVAMDPTATGAISDVTEVTPADVADALAREVANGSTIVPSMLDDATLALGRQLRDDHDPAHLPIRRGM